MDSVVFNQVCHYIFFIFNRSLDQAILLLKDMRDWKEISSVAHKACQLFQEHGSPDTAALLLDKSGKMIEPHLPEEALVLYKYDPSDPMQLLRCFISY